MRPIPFAFFLIGTFVAYFAIHAATGLGDVSLTPGLAVASALAAACLLFAQLFAHIDGQTNQPPKPPYFVIDKVNGPVLELDTNGSYESCELFLTTLAAEFSAEYSGHFDGGPRPTLDKDTGVRHCRQTTGVPWVNCKLKSTSRLEPALQRAAM